ncbi:MAG TPA: hypothetical protein VLH38_00285 [Patescibacteria group bacterium]|nr:hypothetical protein [Patescibacteria group bacterium]
MIPDDFRNYEEIDAIYQQRHKAGMVNEPYIVRVKNGNQTLLFFGARHSNDASDPQVQAIEKEWKQFVADTDTPKIAFCEGGAPPVGKTREEAIRRYSESGLLTWLAKQDGIKVRSPEPNKTQEIDFLFAQGFNATQIMTYYFGRQMLQWARRDYKNKPDWEAYARHLIADYGLLHQWEGNNLTLRMVLRMYEEHEGRAFDPKDEQTLYDLSNPSSSPVSAVSGLCRDISILRAVTRSWQAGRSTFAVYGSGHAIVLERALLKLGH